jgi:hypothetical protein
MPYGEIRPSVHATADRSWPFVLGPLAHERGAVAAVDEGRVPLAISFVRLRANLALLIMALTVLTVLVDGASAGAMTRPFAPDSVWNLPLRADTPISPESDAYVGWLEQAITGDKTWINTAHCAMPTYTAAADTPRVRVNLDATAYQDPALIQAWSSVPIPEAATAAECSDANFAVRQTQSDGRVKQWEFWAARKGSDGIWTARWGGVIDDIRTDRGIASTMAWSDPTAATYAARRSTRFWNVTASSVSMTAGLITAEDLRSGVIDHAISIATPDTAKGKWMWPAQRSDGASTDPAALPEGARLRLDPKLDLDAGTMTPLVRMIAKAAQRYGLILRDRTWSVTTFYGEEFTGEDSSLVSRLLENQYPNHALRAFPWDKLQVLDAPMCTVAAECKRDSRVVLDVDKTSVKVGDRVTVDTTNSVLDYPRKEVRWDLDGDGTFEAAGGAEVTKSVVASAPGRHVIGVSIVTTDGTTTQGTTSFDVVAPDAADPATEPPSGPASEQPAPPAPVPTQPEQSDEPGLEQPGVPESEQPDSPDVQQPSALEPDAPELGQPGETGPEQPDGSVSGQPVAVDPGAAEPVLPDVPDSEQPGVPQPVPPATQPALAVGLPIEPIGPSALMLDSQAPQLQVETFADPLSRVAPGALAPTAPPVQQKPAPTAVGRLARITAPKAVEARPSCGRVSQLHAMTRSIHGQKQLELSGALTDATVRCAGTVQRSRGGLWTAVGRLKLKPSGRFTWHRSVRSVAEASRIRYRVSFKAPGGKSLIRAVVAPSR